MVPPWSPCLSASFSAVYFWHRSWRHLVNIDRPTQLAPSRPFYGFLFHSEWKSWHSPQQPPPKVCPLTQSTPAALPPALCQLYCCLRAFAPALLSAWNTFLAGLFIVYYLTSFETSVKCHLFDEVFLYRPIWVISPSLHLAPCASFLFNSCLSMHHHLT